MNFLEELKRRNVIRVGIAYVVGSWLLAQAADLVLDVMGAPGIILQSLVAILALGFIPVVIFAWAFEMTPEGIRKEKDVDRTQSITTHTAKKLDIATMALLVGAITLLAIDRFVPNNTTEPATVGGSHAADPASSREHGSPPQSAEDTAPITDQKSIAVLPFANRSNQDDDLYFTDGMHDDLLTQLAKIGNLTVISRTSVMEYRDTSKNLKQIGAELNVGTILEGGVQKVGNRVRINTQLIEVATDKHLWAETFDRELTAENIFELQSEIARKITTAIAIQLTPDEEQRLAEIPTQNLAAYEAYLRAREVYYGANYARSQEAAAQPLLEKAVALDPEYAEAHALLALIYSQLYWRGIDTSEELLQKYRATLDRAIAANPSSPSALRVQANYHYRVENDYLRSLELLEQARLTAPGNVDIYGELGFTLRRLGRFEQSIASFERALELDPANRFYHSSMLETMLAFGDSQAIVDNSVPLEDADPGDLDSQVYRAVALMNLQGDLEPLEQVFQKMELVASSTYIQFSAYVYLLKREPAKVLEVVNNPVWQETSRTERLDAVYRNSNLGAAYRLMGENNLARQADEASVARLGEVMDAGMQVRTYGGLEIAVALAHLGRFEEAIALADQMVAEVPPERDAMMQGSLRTRRALVRGLAGDQDGAIDDLEIALKTPSGDKITAWDLYYHPAWDFMRDNPRFTELATPPNVVRTQSP